jgi:hypothetical protein
LNLAAAGEVNVLVSEEVQERLDPQNIARPSRADLELLCANVEGRLREVGHNEPLNLEMIGGDVALPLQCQKLILHLEHRGFLDILVEEANAARPGAPFGDAG